MKPSVGRIIWCIYDLELYRHEVGFVGKQSFIVSDWEDIIRSAMEYDYDDYESTWFTSLSKAKQALLKQASEFEKSNRNLQIKKLADDYYVVEYKDDTRKKSTKCDSRIS